MSKALPTSMLSKILEATMLRIIKGKPLDTIEDKTLVSCLSDLVDRINAGTVNVPTGSVSHDTPEVLIEQAIRAALLIGVDWWTTGSDAASPYSNIDDEKLLTPRVLADLMPEFTTRLYLCQTIGPGKPRKKLKLGETA